MLCEYRCAHVVIKGHAKQVLHLCCLSYINIDHETDIHYIGIHFKVEHPPHLLLQEKLCIMLCCA